MLAAALVPSGIGSIEHAAFAELSPNLNYCQCHRSRHAAIL